MPLTGEAKREYQRTYMRQSRRTLTRAKKQAKALTGKVLKGVALQTTAASSVAQQMVRDALDQKGLDMGLTIKTVKQLHGAKRPYGKEALMSADNQARARGCELAIDLYSKAGLMPKGDEPLGGRADAKIRMVQIDPDGTERWLEIG